MTQPRRRLGAHPLALRGKGTIDGYITGSQLWGSQMYIGQSAECASVARASNQLGWRFLLQ
jgi:hypothetical protein